MSFSPRFTKEFSVKSDYMVSARQGETTQTSFLYIVTRSKGENRFTSYGVRKRVGAAPVRGGNNPRFSIRKIFQLYPELGQKCSEITNKMFKRTKHP